MIVADVAVAASFILLTVGICSVVANVKFALYKVAIVGYLTAVVLFVVVLIIYPTMALRWKSDSELSLFSTHLAIYLIYWGR